MLAEARTPWPWASPLRSHFRTSTGVPDLFLLQSPFKTQQNEQRLTSGLEVTPLPTVCLSVQTVSLPLLWATGCGLPKGFGHMCGDPGVFGEEEGILAGTLSVDRDR